MTYLCKMKYLVLFLFLCSSSLAIGQRYKTTLIDLRLDSIAKENVKTKIIAVHKAQMSIFQSVRWFRFSVKPKIELYSLADLYTNLTHDNVDILMESSFSGVDFGDLMGLVKYDVRLVIFPRARMQVVNKVRITGINTNRYAYTFTYTYKF